jgi:hypothetical protein
MNNINPGLNSANNDRQEIERSKNTGYKIIIAVLCIIILVLSWLLFSQKKLTTAVTNEKELKTKFLQEELNGLMSEHDSIKVEYAQLADKLSQKDSLISIQAKEIRGLIASQADYKRIKKKLDYLRNITQGYVHQIDSLYTVNKELKEENVAITNKYYKSKQVNEELQKDKQQLTEKVNIASLLKASGISAVALKAGTGTKEKTTDKASKTDRIKICFTILENQVAAGGLRTVYIRIARPDKKIITQGNEDIYSFELDGQKLQYTLKKDINYENKAQNVCVFWEKKDKSQEAMKGTYEVLIYADNNMIGTTQFALR